MSIINKHIGFGCVALTQQTFVSDAIKLLELAYENGITHFDTAPIYGNGYSEKIVGKFALQKKNNLQIVTKVGLGNNVNSTLPIALALPLNKLQKAIKKSKQPSTRFTPPSIINKRIIDEAFVKKSIENSLRNLNNAHIDTLLLHEALPDFLTDEALKYLLSLKEKGIISKLGVAASWVNIETLENNSLINWDILQYENGLKYPSQNLVKTFPNKTHIYHSIFKGIKEINIPTELKAELPGILLANCLKNNPNGRFLFSTTNKSNLVSNLKSFEKYASIPDVELNKIMRDAIL
jgi:aryl-alcohol dehydrogenase-like predicted oxidoreductase